MRFEEAEVLRQLNAEDGAGFVWAVALRARACDLRSIKSKARKREGECVCVTRCVTTCMLKVSAITNKPVN